MDIRPTTAAEAEVGSRIHPPAPVNAAYALTGLVSNVTVRNAELYNVSRPIHIYQTNGAHP